jgi:acyl carrier protein
MTTREQITAMVIELAAAEGGVGPAECTPATHFVNDLEFDSLSAMEFPMKVEDTFAISIPDDQAQKMQTIGEVIDYVAAHLPTATPASAHP